MAARNVHPRRAHKYLRVPVKGVNAVYRFRYRCMMPGCTHFLNEDMIIGQTCECWRCGKEFVVDTRTSQLKKLHCRDCTKRKNIVVEGEVKESPI